MSQDIFNKRIARIQGHADFGQGAMTSTESGTATSKFSSPVSQDDRPKIGRNIRPFVLGALIGMVVGTLAAGIEDPDMPWGPGFAYSDMLWLPVVLGLCAGPLMAIVASATRARFPKFFFFAAAYFPFVIATALLDLPLF